MCYQSAGPKGSDEMGMAKLTVPEVERIIREAAEIETITPRFHLTGGEAFLDIESMLHLVGYARDHGFLDLTTTTNAFWARTPARALEVKGWGSNLYP